MRKVIFELLLLGIAIGLTVEVIKSAIPYLPFIWLAVFSHYTWEAVTTDRALDLCHSLKGRWAGNKIMYSYVIVALAGAGLFSLYWWGLTSFFAPKIAAYQAEQQRKKSESVHTDLSKPPETQPHPEIEGPPRLTTTKPVENHPTDAVETKPQRPRVKHGPVEPSQAVVQVAPAFGNLTDRAKALSGQIMEDLYQHGWPRRNDSGQLRVPIQQMPTKAEEVQQWTKSRSSYFRFRFFEAVLDIRNEFAQLHLRDDRLDDFFKYQGMIEQANRQMEAANLGRQIDAPILPQQIVEVAARLNVLAKQIPTHRAAPRPLHFSVTRVQPEKPEFPFEIVVAINADAYLASGYIVVEFDGPKASIATDFPDSKLLLPNDEGIIGNRPLKEYLLSHSFGDIYALEIGGTPFTPEKPVHVIAYGAKPFQVTRVTLYDE